MPFCTVLKASRGSKGFTLIEVLVAMALLLISLAGLAQLLPTAVVSNTRNRHTSVALASAQRMLDQMLAQPLSATQFTNVDGVVCQLGGASAAAGNSLIETVDGVGPDFSTAAVTGYNYTFRDANSPGRPPVELRWGVITTLVSGRAVAKRFVVGARGPNVLPVSLEAVIGG